MTEYILSFKPAIDFYGNHDPSAVLFEDGKVVFGVEEERYTRVKHAKKTFPEQSIRACLEYAGIGFEDVDKIILPYDPQLEFKKTDVFLKRKVGDYISEIRNNSRKDSGSSQQNTTGSTNPNQHPFHRVWGGLTKIKKQVDKKYFANRNVEKRLRNMTDTVPPIERRSHHLCHAAGAFYPTEFDTALVLTADGKGEYDSTVVWKGTPDGVERVKTYRVPNSLGYFYGAVTDYIGYRPNNGEGKVMGLAPYGEHNKKIEHKLRSVATFGREYDVTSITRDGLKSGAAVLEELFDRPRNTNTNEFSKFEKDLAYTSQLLLEETITDIVKYYARRLDQSNVCFNGGVALNCKLNKRIMELDCVDELFIQPVAHDGGLALGAGWNEYEPDQIEPMTNVYWGEAPCEDDIETLLESSKISYKKVDNVERYTAEKLADGALVGWMQGRLEMGPRALGNRSILADPRTEASRDNVNRHVKHREEWRPFAPSLLEEKADRYLVDAGSSPYMIKTYETVPENRSEIEAVVHPEDNTTRPQTVRRDQNPRYYDLISAFEDITGVPVVLNTSFNDHGEPIVTTPNEAVADFYTMGLDVLVIGDYVVEKSNTNE